MDETAGKVDTAKRQAPPGKDAAMKVMSMRTMSSSGPARSRGLAMIFALIALAVLTTGAVALIRSIDTGAMAMGNLAFKQSALNSSSVGTDAAIGWLDGQTQLMAANPGQLDQDNPAAGYYATAMDALDPTGNSVGTARVQALVDWDRTNCLVNGKNVAPAACIQPSNPVQVGSDTVRYVITRMCSSLGSSFNAVPPNSCATGPMPDAKDSTSKNTGQGYSDYSQSSAPANPYYRIIARTVGARGTVSYTETLVSYPPDPNKS